MQRGGRRIREGRQDTTTGPAVARGQLRDEQGFALEGTKPVQDHGILPGGNGKLLRFQRDHGAGRKAIRIQGHGDATHHGKVVTQPELGEAERIGLVGKIQRAHVRGQITGRRGKIEHPGPGRALMLSEEGGRSRPDGQHLAALVLQVIEHACEGGQRGIEALGVEGKGGLIRGDLNFHLLEGLWPGGVRVEPRDAMHRLAVPQGPRGGMPARVGGQERILIGDAAPAGTYRLVAELFLGVADQENIVTISRRAGHNRGLPRQHQQSFWGGPGRDRGVIGNHGGQPVPARKPLLRAPQHQRPLPREYPLKTQRHSSIPHTIGMPASWPT